MKSAKKPDISVEEIYTLCVQNFLDTNLVERLLSCKLGVVNASNSFNKLAEKHETYKMSECLADKGVVSGNELKRIYTRKLSPPNAIGKRYYSEILAIPQNGLCPLCGTRTVSTLDHYLAKSHYPSLAVTPNNLVAACRDCNFMKSDMEFTSSDDETLHPYYDDIENHKWVYCDVLEENPIGFRYAIKMIGTTDNVLFRRIAKHFDVFRLGRLYSIKASEMISGIEIMLKRLYTRSGKNAVRLQIEEDMISRESKSLNSWQSAFYRGIYDSEWFFDEWLSH